MVEHKHPTTVVQNLGFIQNTDANSDVCFDVSTLRKHLFYFHDFGFVFGPHSHLFINISDFLSCN